MRTFGKVIWDNLVFKVNKTLGEEKGSRQQSIRIHFHSRLDFFQTAEQISQRNRIYPSPPPHYPKSRLKAIEGPRQNPTLGPVLFIFLYLGNWLIIVYNFCLKKSFRDPLKSNLISVKLRSLGAPKNRGT